MSETSSNEEFKLMMRSAYVPLLFIFIIWMIEIIQMLFGFDLTFISLKPRSAFGLIGIFTAPFLHGGWDHLISNTTSILVLWSMIFYFYKSLAMRVFVWVYIGSGILVWLLARPSFHLGASGLIYGFAAFLFVSGVIRRHTALMAVALVVTVFYGGLIWGVFPVQPGVSWESHLFGGIMGIIIAIILRDEGPQKEEHVWEEEEDEWIGPGPFVN